jgi:DNA modification methylase
MNLLIERRIEYRPVTALVLYANNPRTHSKVQIRQIADSILEFGWTNPVLVDCDNNVIAGHGRIEAAKLLGITDVPVLLLEDMNESQKRAYIIADNKLAENASWDEVVLAIELQGLLDPEIEFDIELTGFGAGEIHVLLGSAVASEPEDVVLPDPEAPVVSRPGDLWLIGPHRILCGNTLDAQDWETLMCGDKAQMVFTDPPYNVKIAGNVSGLGNAKHREFAMASGEMDTEQFSAFLRTSFEHMVENSADGAIHFVCMDWRHMGEMLSASGGVYTELKNLCVWAKTNAGMGTFYRSQHELVFAFKSGTQKHINNFGLGEQGRHRSNLWTYAGANTFRAGRMADLESHPTVKPLDMIADAILDCSKLGGIVVDAFAGSGATLIAAARSGRVGLGIEIDPAYVDLIVKRLEEETGDQAIHGDLFDSFEEVKNQRLIAAK